MARKALIQIFAGQKAQLPTLAERELGYCEDTDELFIGTPAGNHQIGGNWDFWIGIPLPYPSSTPPSGFFECNGAAISRTTYSKLFARIGTTFGTGDGSTTFNLPDLRGEFIRGWDQGRGVDVGRTLGSAQQDEFRMHYHDFEYGMDTIFSDGPNNRPDIRDGGIIKATHTTGGAETRPRNVAMMYIIKY